ncbi:hypothetical protein P4O66_008753 [Electrophorus voltai]|uniref:Guanylate kinase-like domain-containing protein n=1 Tax=Electrophorus voltai TaxID=2609070 RepID=A0AAD9DZY4_9TELE|nr:hypothetical protein P4O66_008753 [Electrophorus voltai]
MCCGVSLKSRRSAHGAGPETDNSDPCQSGWRKAPCPCAGAQFTLMCVRLFSRFFSAMAGPRPVVLSGPSGAGKSSLLKQLLQEFHGVFGFSVSHTTRKPRPGEQDGKGPDFSVLSPNGSEQLLVNTSGRAVMSSVCAHQRCYLCAFASKAAVQEVQGQNLICILDVDMQGVKSIKRTGLNPIYISIQPPSMDVLEKRLRERKTESEESLQKRLQAARVDMEISREPGLFDVVIINDHLEEAYEALKGALLPSSRSWDLQYVCQQELSESSSPLSFTVHSGMIRFLSHKQEIQKVKEAKKLCDATQGSVTLGTGSS